LKDYRVFKNGTPVNGVVRASNEKEAVEKVFLKLNNLARFSGITRDQLVAKEVFFGDT
jgi:hypothetical protein